MILLGGGEIRRLIVSYMRFLICGWWGDKEEEGGLAGQEECDSS